MGLYVGMDLHSSNCYTGILNEQAERVWSRRLPNDQDQIIRALAPYRERIEGIAVESTYNWYWLVDRLMEEGYRLHLANPAAMKPYAGIKHLDDRHDAFWLAAMLKLGILPEGYIYPREQRGLRDLLRQRSRFVVQKTSLKHTLQQIYANYLGTRLSNNTINTLEDSQIQEQLEDPDSSAIGSRLLDTLRFVEGQIRSIERQVKSRLADQSPYTELTSVPGIGVTLGLTITLETGPVSRFASAGQYASYCRCVPTAYWSNTKPKGGGNKRNGNKYLAWAFSEAANFCIRYCPLAKGYYQRKAAKTNQPSAYRAVANKLAKACYFIMRDHVPFDVNRLFRG